MANTRIITKHTHVPIQPATVLVQRHGYTAEIRKITWFSEPIPSKICLKEHTQRKWQLWKHLVEIFLQDASLGGYTTVTLSLPVVEKINPTLLVIEKINFEIRLRVCAV